MVSAGVVIAYIDTEIMVTSKSEMCRDLHSEIATNVLLVEERER